MNNLKFIGILFLTILLQVSCSKKKKPKDDTQSQTKTENTVKRVSVIDVLSPKSGALFTIGEDIPVNIILKETDIIVDSLHVQANEIKATLNTNELGYTWNTKDLKTGNNHLKISAYSEGNKIDSYTLKLRFKSDITPEIYECKIIKTYPHNKSDYTQGLFYDNGILYEGTGQRGQSVLKKMDFESGKLLAELSLPPKYFGEGITAYKDKIIQLTWKSQIGFVYDKKSFKLLTTLGYPTEGWGITTDGKKLIMSDGSNVIHFLDPEYFNQIGKIEVYDNKGLIDYLNELEYINGMVYANVYQSEEIVVFDPETGKVLKRIDCSNIIPDGYKGEYDNVLNGIAYDKDNNRYFVTGKRWPSLFQVEFVKKW